MSGVSFEDHESDSRCRALTDTAPNKLQSTEINFQTQVGYNILLKPVLTVSLSPHWYYSAILDGCVPRGQLTG